MRHFEEAAREFKQALERAPLNAQAHFDLALCEFRLLRSDDAIKELQAALALEPWYTRAEELLADIYLHKKDYVQARARSTTATAKVMNRGFRTCTPIYGTTASAGQRSVFR